ncbi:MAG: CoA-transferase [Acidimicrobiia bacterium]|nr:CoA-transferase [Acidimicrobiia bacterium]
MAAGAGEATRAEVCAVACAEAWRGDGEIVASPIGTVPTIGARLAALTFEPDLVLTDGDALVTSMADLPLPVGAPGDAPRVVEGWLPFGKMFDLLWWGRRHVMMGATQVDRLGNQNIACIGPWEKPKAMLLGVRGAPGNTVNHPTSYWVPNHSPRVFVEHVDFVSGVGYDRVPPSAAVHDIRVVVSNLGVFDFDTPDHSMRVRSVHPGVTVEEVQEATGFALAGTQGDAGEVAETRSPTDEELRLIRDVLDPQSLRDAEVKG